MHLLERVPLWVIQKTVQEQALERGLLGETEYLLWISVWLDLS